MNFSGTVQAEHCVQKKILYMLRGVTVDHIPRGKKMLWQRKVIRLSSQNLALLLVAMSLLLTLMSMPMVKADPGQTISLSPNIGAVGTLVTVNGTDFAPDEDVQVMWNMSITGDFVAVGDGAQQTFSLVLCDSVKADSETMYLDGVIQTRNVDYTVDYTTGVVTFVIPPKANVVVAADYELEIHLTEASTDGDGNFTATFMVPESYAGLHTVYAFDETGNNAMDIFEVEPQIVLSSTKGPPEAWITISGTGYALNENVSITASIFGYPGGGYYDESSAPAVTDARGTFAEAIALPSSLNLFDALMSGYPAVPIVIWAEDDVGNYSISFYIAVLWCHSEPSSIEVDVKVGEFYFPGEVITVYASTSVDGLPTDVDDLEFLAYYETLGPVSMSHFLPIVHVDTGLYAVTTTLVGDVDPGNYLFEVWANKTTYWLDELVYDGWWVDWLTYFHSVDPMIELAWEEFWYTYMGYWPVTIHGVGIESFIISPTLIGMNATLVRIEGEVATINTNIGPIQLNLMTIRADLIGVQNDLAIINSTLGEIDVKLDDINATLVALDGTVATLETDIGTIQTDIGNLQLAVTSIEGDTATIDTSLGTIQGRITSIEGDTATIETDIGTVKTDVSDVKAAQGGLSTPLYVAIILALTSAAGVIILLLSIRGKTLYTPRKTRANKA